MALDFVACQPLESRGSIVYKVEFIGEQLRAGGIIFLSCQDPNSSDGIANYFQPREHAPVEHLSVKRKQMVVIDKFSVNILAAIHEDSLLQKNSQSIELIFILDFQYFVSNKL